MWNGHTYFEGSVMLSQDLNDDLLPKVDGRINGRDKQ